MDSALDISGSYKTDSAGYPYMLEGRQEVLQQAYILLCAKSGGFIYDRELGCGDYEDEAQLEAAARDALRELPELEISGVSITPEKTSVTVLLEGETSEIIIRRNE